MFLENSRKIEGDSAGRQSLGGQGATTEQAIGGSAAETLSSRE